MQCVIMYLAGFSVRMHFMYWNLARLRGQLNQRYPGESLSAYHCVSEVVVLVLKLYVIRSRYLPHSKCAKLCLRNDEWCSFRPIGIPSVWLLHSFAMFLFTCILTACLCRFCMWCVSDSTVCGCLPSNLFWELLQWMKIMHSIDIAQNTQVQLIN